MTPIISNLVSGKVALTDDTSTAVIAPASVGLSWARSGDAGEYVFTITESTHGRATGDFVKLTSCTDPRRDGMHKITVVNANTYTIPIGADDPGASGTVTVGSGRRVVVMGVSVTNGDATVPTKVQILDGTTVKMVGYLSDIDPAAVPWVVSGGGCPLFVGTEDVSVMAKCAASGADVDVFIWGYLV